MLVEERGKGEGERRRSGFENGQSSCMQASISKEATNDG